MGVQMFYFVFYKSSQNDHYDFQQLRYEISSDSKFSISDLMDYEISIIRFGWVCIFSVWDCMGLQMFDFGFYGFQR